MNTAITKQQLDLAHEHNKPLNIIQSDSASLMAVISRAASDPNMDVNKLERMMAMYERMEASNAEQSFNRAMSDAQEKMLRISADASNPQTKSKYASYAALDRVLRPIYTALGFSLSFDTGDGAPESYVKVVCYVSHKDGHTRTYHVDMPADGKGAKGGDVMTKTHATGSAMTYGQRYLLKMIFNVAIGTDDDGNKAAETGGPITAEQAETIRTMIADTKSDVELFCNHFHIAAIPDMPAKDYERAVSALKKKAKAV